MTLWRRRDLAASSSYSAELEEVVEIKDEALLIVKVSGSGSSGPGALEWSGHGCIFAM